MAIGKKAKASGESAIFLLVFAAILVVVNVLSVRWFVRTDLTARKVHSLSEASLHVMERLQDRLEVKAYFTEDLPPPFNAHARYIRDILEEYAAYSHGRMRFQFIDPGEDEKKNEEAKRLGIEKVRHRVFEKEGASFKDGYRGLAFTYMGQTKSIPVIQDTQGLEYEITSIIKQLLKDRVAVAFVTGHGEPDFAPPEQQDPEQPRAPTIKLLHDSLENYNVRAVSLGGDSKIPENTRALLLLGPSKKLEPRELFKLDQYLMRGGALAVLVDGMRVATGGPNLTAEKNDTGINDLIGAYGIRINDDLVFDAQCSRIPARAPGGLPIPIAVLFPPWPRLAKLASDHPVAFRLSNLTLGFASSLRINPSLRHSKKLKLTVLGRSTPDQSWSEGEGVDMDPFQQWKLGHHHGPFVLAAAVEGHFRSAWAGRHAPAEDDQVAQESHPEEEVLQESQKPGRLLVVGDSDLLQDTVVGLMQRMQQTEQPSNLVFGANAVDWLTQEQGLIAVRAKNVEDPDLREVSDQKKVLYKWGNIFAWPILFGLYGFVRSELRKKRRAAVKL
jgi:gliding motility-associatede transport system auxiliary component